MDVISNNLSGNAVELISVKDDVAVDLDQRSVTTSLKQSPSPRSQRTSTSNNHQQ